MSSDGTTYTGTSIGFVLFIVFLVLKLTGTIDWSWFWVIFPLWAGIGLVLVILGIIVLIMLIIGSISGISDLRSVKRRKR